MTAVAFRPRLKCYISVNNQSWRPYLLNHVTFPSATLKIKKSIIISQITNLMSFLNLTISLLLWVIILLLKFYNTSLVTSIVIMQFLNSVYPCHFFWCYMMVFRSCKQVKLIFIVSDLRKLSLFEWFAY